MNMKTKNRSLAAFSLLMAVALTGCNFAPEEPPLGLADAFVTFPESISSTGGSRSVGARSSADVISHVQGLYTPVRDSYNKLAEDAIAFIADILDSIDRNIFGDDNLMEYLEANGSVVLEGDSGTNRWRITKGGDAYTVAGWKQYDEAWAQSLYVDFSAVGDDISGTAWVAADKADAGRTLFEASFDTNDPTAGSLTELRAVNLDDQAAELFNVPTALWLTAYNDGTEFQIAANVYYEDVNIENGDFEQYFMGVLNNGQVSGFTDNQPGVHGCYSYRGAFLASGSDRGQIDLALVPANYTGTDIFSAYSVGMVYRSAIADWVRADSTLIDAINTVTTTAPDLTSGSSDADVMTALDEVYAADPSNTELENIIFVTKLTNPAYFDGSQTESFVGTAGTHPDLAWASELPAFALSIDVDQTTLPALAVTFPAAMEATPPAPTF